MGRRGGGGGKDGGEERRKALAHLLHGNGGWFGARFLDLGGRVALLVPHGKDGGRVHHGQVGGQPAVQAAAYVLGWGGAE